MNVVSLVLIAGCSVTSVSPVTADTQRETYRRSCFGEGKPGSAALHGSLCSCKDGFRQETPRDYHSQTPHSALFEIPRSELRCRSRKHNPWNVLFHHPASGRRCWNNASASVPYSVTDGILRHSWTIAVWIFIGPLPQSSLFLLHGSQCAAHRNLGISDYQSQLC